jgi:hypothetical protein
MLVTKMRHTNQIVEIQVQLKHETNMMKTNMNSAMNSILHFE